MGLRRDSWSDWRRTFGKHRGLIVMILPAVAFFAVFHYAPMVGVVIAFKDFMMRLGVFGSPWCGLDNFRRLFASNDFPDALRNTIVISLLRLAFGFVAPIVLALLLNEARVSWFKRSVQTATYIPHFLSWVILGGIFLMLFSQRGPVNQIVLSLWGGLHSLAAAVGLATASATPPRPIEFLTNDAWFLVTLIVTGIWQSAGYGAVIYLAALAGISPTLYEAAVVDGAGRWQQTRHVTLPCLSPTIVTLFILNLGHILNAGFDQIYNMYNPMVYDVADIIDTYVLRRLMTMDFGLATAAGLFKSVVGLFLVVVVNAVARRSSGGEMGVF